MPPVEKRKRFPLVPRLNEEIVRLDRDGDYLCYQAGALVYYMGIAILCFMLVDVLFSWELLIDPDILAEKKIHFVSAWHETLKKFAFPIAVLFYLRLRLTIDLKNDRVPVFLDIGVISRTDSRRQVIGTAAFALTVSLLFLLFPYTGEGGFLYRVGIENNLIAIMILQFVFLIGAFAFTCWAISMAFVLEKSVRFFTKIKRDFESV